MKERSGMPYDVVAFENDELALALTPEEEGIFHRMMRKAWMNGSIPADLTELAHLCRVNPRTMRKAWTHLGPMWTPKNGNADRIISKKIERERKFLEHRRNMARISGKASAKAREIKRTTSTVVQLDSSTSPPLPNPSQPSSSTNVEEKKKGTPPTENRGGRNDPAAEMFKAKYLENIGNPYEWLAGDFPQMAKLRKRLKLQSDETPPDWEPALTNYFGTPLAEYSLQHFAAKFDTFKNSQLDRFHVPTNHKGNGNGREKESHGERVARKNRETAAQFDHELFGADGDGDGPGSAQGESAALLPRPK